MTKVARLFEEEKIVEYVKRFSIRDVEKLKKELENKEIEFSNVFISSVVERFIYCL